MNNEKIYGWTGRILKVDLTSGNIEHMDSRDYVHKFIGGKGLNHRLAWDELDSRTKAFAPENCLFISVGPLTGTAAPNSGRATIGGISAQSFPEMYTHSGVGGWFPAAVKYAGFDAIIIKGKSPFKCYLYIDGEDVNIKPADDLWGLGTYDTQQLLKRKHGQEVHTLCIGPAGENLSRIAVLLTDTENAAGQGGFGGVAGSKNLKAICIKGPHEVKIAHPHRLLELRKENMHAAQTTPLIKNMPYSHSGQTVQDFPYGRNRVSCSHSCDRHCFWNFHDVPGVTRPSLHTGKWGCVGWEAINWQTPGGIKWPLWSVGMVDGQLTRQSVQAGFETSRLINQYGLNAWELLAGMVPWLVMADRTGVIREEEKKFKEILPIDADNPEWWVNLIKVITYGKGTIGKLLSQGNYRAIKALGDKFENTVYYRDPAQEKTKKGNKTKISLQAAWGYAGHWTGRGIQSNLEFPFYLIQALVWMTASRDPLNDTHIEMSEDSKKKLENAKDPYSMKLIPEIAIWNENRSELKSSLTLCDWAFPNMNNTKLESKLFSAVTGIEYKEKELDRVGERCKNMQRALLIRDYDRDFETEFNEIMPWFKRPDGTEGISVDEDKFKKTVQEYYKQRRWDKNGRPTKKTLDSLGLNDIADELVRLGKIN